MLKIRYSSRFKKDFKIIVKRGYDVFDTHRNPQRPVLIFKN